MSSPEQRQPSDRSVPTRDLLSPPTREATTSANRTVASDRIVAGIFVLACLYYLALAVGRKLQLFAPVGLGMTFNSMMLHLLQFRFDVDPASIASEGFLRDGRTYAYFGIFPALLRLPLLAVRDGATIDLTLCSTLLASCLCAGFLLRTAVAIHRVTPASRVRAVLFWALVTAIVLSGSQVEFLRLRIYQEVAYWAAAFAAMFLYYAVRGLIVERHFSTSLLLRLGVVAGLCLLTRVSTGLGLYVAMALLLLRLALRAGTWNGRKMGTLLAPACVLAGFALVVALVNYERWGNPFTFMDPRYYIMYGVIPDGLSRVQRYGQFNIQRLWYGVIYYFAPIWGFAGQDGRPLFIEARQRLIELTELPPGSFLLSDPLLFLLGISGCLARIDPRGRIDMAGFTCVLVGLAVPCGLMLIAIAMAFRYRLEFYPLLYFWAFFGFYRLCFPPVGTSVRRWPPPAVIWGCVGVGVLVAHVSLLLYKASPLGDAEETFQYFYRLQKDQFVHTLMWSSFR
jgi:hypothetical protein